MKKFGIALLAVLLALLPLASCGNTLDTMDVGAHRKFIGKCDSEYLCRDCIAKHFGWTRETLDAWILKFRRNGCLLFPPLTDGDGCL